MKNIVVCLDSKVCTLCETLDGFYADDQAYSFESMAEPFSPLS